MKKKKNEAKPKKQVSKKVDDKGKYFHCNVEGHWRRNCSAYLTIVKNRKKNGFFERMSDLLIIESNLMVFSSSSWVLDFDSSAHVCTSIQELEEVGGLREGEITLQISNGARVVVVTIETYSLRLSL